MASVRNMIVESVVPHVQAALGTEILVTDDPAAPVPKDATVKVAVQCLSETPDAEESTLDELAIVAQMDVIIGAYTDTRANTLVNDICDQVETAVRSWNPISQVDWVNYVATQGDVDLEGSDAAAISVVNFAVAYTRPNR